MNRETYTQTFKGRSGIMNNNVITIGRQYGSGGHEIGEKLSKLLEIPLYDKNLVEMAAEKLNLAEGDVDKLDEKALYGFVSSYQPVWGAIDNPYYLADYNRPLTDRIFEAQSSIIQTLGYRGPCIIVGRCADYVLRDYPHVVNVFICANKEDRIKRIMERYHLTEKEAASRIRKTDRSRRNYYEMYTDREWGSINSHQLLLNVSILGQEKVINIIKHLYETQ